MLAVLSQCPQGQAMKRPGPDIRERPPLECIQSQQHLPSGVVGEGHEQHPVWGQSLTQKVGDAMSERPRLARSRPRQHQQWSGWGHDDLLLFLGQTRKQGVGRHPMEGSAFVADRSFIEHAST